MENKKLLAFALDVEILTWMSNEEIEKLKNYK